MLFRGAGAMGLWFRYCKSVIISLKRVNRRGQNQRPFMSTIMHSSPLPEVDIPAVTITAHVLRRASALADHVAIRDISGASSYTFAELSDAIHSLDRRPCRARYIAG